MSAAAVDARTQEQHAWRDLLDSPGWTRLVAHAQTEWAGPGFLQQVETLADNPQDPVALSKLRQLLAAKRAVLRLLAVPEEQIMRAKQREEYDPRIAPDLADITKRRGRL